MTLMISKPLLASTQISTIITKNTKTTKIDWTKLVHAIHMVETGGLVGPTLGDNGNALGPLQIHRSYFKDSNVSGSYNQVSVLRNATVVFLAYMDRYCISNRLGRAPTAEDVARIHNGGPNGYKKASTIKYWHKVRKYYESSSSL